MWGGPPGPAASLEDSSRCTPRQAGQGAGRGRGRPPHIYGGTRSRAPPSGFPGLANYFMLRAFGSTFLNPAGISNNEESAGPEAKPEYSVVISISDPDCAPPPA